MQHYAAGNALPPYANSTGNIVIGWKIIGVYARSYCKRDTTSDPTNQVKQTTARPSPQKSHKKSGVRQGVPNYRDRSSHVKHTDGEYRSNSKFRNPSEHKPATSSGEKDSGPVAVYRKFWNKLVRVFSKPVAEDKHHLLGGEKEGYEYRQLGGRGWGDGYHLLRDDDEDG